MSSPASLNRLFLYPCKAFWKLRRACLAYLALACCALWIFALLSASFQVSWEILDTRAFVGHGILETTPLRTAKAASP